ncbi:MAG: Fic family protein, partial [Spirochaetota bacterium]|nr:Fic family protein [Spirochaetota bacterium]
MKQDTSSSYNNIEELSKVIGFNPNEPYLAPNKIRYKLGKLDRKLANELTKHIVTIRKSISKTIHLKDQEGKYFWYCQTPEIEKYLHKIDTEFRNDLLTFVGKGIEQINKNSLLMDSLTEEAFYSSRIEGAITTHKRAKELVKRELLPQNKSERMMKNNYFAMDFILKHKNEHFDVNMILELHKIVTQSTLDPDDEKYIGKFRDNNNTCIKNISTNEINYTPPDHKRIKALINDLVNWVTSDEPFVHPVLKASIIHFYLS